MTLLCYISLKLQANLLDTVPAGGGGGYTPSYKLCTYALSQTVPFRSVGHFGVESGMVECIRYLSFQFQMNKKESVIWKVEMEFKKSFCWCPFVSNNETIS